MSSASWQSLAHTDTIYAACSTEFLPSASPSWLACGTYQVVVDEATPVDAAAPKTKRLGRLLLYDVSERRLEPAAQIDCPAILDMRWRPADQPRLAVARADGRVALYGFDNRSLQELSAVQCADDSVLCLSLDWSKHDQADEYVVSLSNGEIVIVNEAEQIAERWHAHDHEPWIASFDHWDAHTLWTGGDDLKLKRWDRRAGFDAPSAMHKRFDGGVTTIASSPFRDHQLAVGSYDSSIRLFDTRQLARPLSTLDVGGGLWRLKWHPSDSSRLLAACMHDGFKIVDAGDAEMSIAARFDAHGSLAYGADWIGDALPLVASCSFYDHLLHLSTVH